MESVPTIQARVRSLRAEAHLMTAAGAALLAIGISLTVALLFLGEAVSPFAPLLVGAIFCAPGWALCHFATVRLERANALLRDAS